MNEDQTFQSPYIPDPFSVFCHKNRDIIVAQNPNASMYEINSKLNDLWSNMSDYERQTYKEVTDMQPPPRQNAFNQYHMEMTPQVIWPSDPQKYLVWLGTKVVQQYTFGAHPNIIEPITDDKSFTPNLQDINLILQKLKNPKF